MSRVRPRPVVVVLCVECSKHHRAAVRGAELPDTFPCDRCIAELRRKCAGKKRQVVLVDDGAED